MRSPIRRAACLVSLVLAGLLVAPAAAWADECPVGNVSVGGVCTRPSTSPTPSPDPTPDPTTTPDPDPEPEPTATRSPRGTRSPKPRTTPPPATQTSTPAPGPTQTVPFPSDFPTDYGSFPETEGEYPLGEDRPIFPTGPGLAAAPTASQPQGSGLQIFTLLVAAGIIAFLLIRARVRRWMVGI